VLLEVSGRAARYGSVPAPRDASLSVGAGEAVGLIDPDGAAGTDLSDILVRASAA